MVDSIDWTDETLRSLDELARIAFPPDSGVTANTLKLRARQGKLAVYRPGKAYLSTLMDVKAMLEATRVRACKPREPSPAVPNALGLTEADLARMRCEHALQALRDGVDRERAEKKRQRGRLSTKPIRRRDSKLCPSRV
jgi:hypothetical protein